MSKEESSEYKSRLREMTAVLHKHGITRGVTPEKLRLILEDLGPTYIKIGQIMSMHSDILPKRYYEELMRLCSEVAPMSFEEVEEILQDSYGMDWREIFQNIEEKPLGSASIAQVMMDLMDVMKENKIIMPHGLTMLARGLTHIEGILADISPDINMIGIAATRIKGDLLHTMDWKKELKKNGKLLYRSLHKSIELPALLSDIMHGYLKGQTRVNLDFHVSRELAQLLRRLIRNIVMGLWVMALLISSSIICITDMKPKIWGIPAIGAIGYLIAFCIVIYVFLKHIFSKK